MGLFAGIQHPHRRDVQFRALSLEALIASKRAVRRKKDLEHLIELEALLELRRGREGSGQ